MWAALGRELDWRRAAPEGEGTRLPSDQRRGPSPKMRLGGPPGSLGWASLSGPFGPWPQGGPQSHPGRHLGGGRGRGLRAPRKGAGKISPSPHRTAGGEARVWRAGGSQATSDLVEGRLRRRQGGPSARAKVGGIPSARARHSPGSAPSGIRSVRSGRAGARARGGCLARRDPAPLSGRGALSPDAGRPRSRAGGVPSGREGLRSPARRSAFGDSAATAPSAAGKVRKPPAPGEGPRAPRGRGLPGPATNARGRGPAGFGGRGAGGSGAGRRRGGDASERAEEARRGKGRKGRVRGGRGRQPRLCGRLLPPAPRGRSPPQPWASGRSWPGARATARAGPPSDASP